MAGADPTSDEQLLLYHQDNPDLIVSAPVADVRRYNVEHMINRAQTFEELGEVIEKCGYIEWDPRNDPEHVATPDELADAIAEVRGGGPPARRALTRIPSTHGLKKRVVGLGIEMLAGPPVSERTMIPAAAVPAPRRSARKNGHELTVSPYARSILFP